ncbi:MAG: hypothetical protein KDB53_02090 [Planctomycetes bacterium]|nr:hypothetical protein [Planctomycetota bacterium]
MFRIASLVVATVLSASWIASPAQGQGSTVVTGLNASFRSGQTFLTWNEVAGTNVKYRVYRAASDLSTLPLPPLDLLGEVGQDSTLNKRETQITGVTTHYTITDLGPALSSTKGLFVHTCLQNAPGWYLVRAVVGTSEDQTVTVGQNALATAVNETVAKPVPIMQTRSGATADYAHWVSDRATPLLPALWFAPSRAFNLRVIYSPSYGQTLRPVLVHLHARTFTNKVAPEAGHPETLVLAPDDWFEEFPNNSYWYGMNEAFPDSTQYANHDNVDYTQRRVMVELDWAITRFRGDPERVYARGFSMGATGALFLGATRPDVFAATQAIAPKMDFGCVAPGCWIEPYVGTALWGPPSINPPSSDGVATYTRLDLGALCGQSRAVDFPFMHFLGGRLDGIVGWSEKPNTQADLAAAKQPFAFYWDAGVHTGPGASVSGIWASTIDQRRLDMWDLRRDRPQAAFSNLSLDDNPGTGPSLIGDLQGCVNGYATWDAATATATSTQVTMTCRLRSAGFLDDAPTMNATVDWTPRRTQAFPRVAGQYYRFRNRQLPLMTVIQESIVTADADGVITVPQAMITTAGNEFELETIDLSGPQPVLAGATSAAVIGSTLELHFFGQPGVLIYLFTGFTPGNVTLPGTTGSLQIADPVGLMQLSTQFDGHSSVVLPLPVELSFYVGVSFRVQSIFDLMHFSNPVDFTLSL